MLVGGRVDKQTGRAKEGFLERIGNGEEEEDFDGVGYGKSGGDSFSSPCLQTEGCSQCIELTVVRDVLWDSVVVAAWTCSVDGRSCTVKSTRGRTYQQ
jgi:hypothetical protein